MNDDHGDQFPGALPPPAIATPGRRSNSHERLVRMRAAYLQKVNSAVEADREDLAHELAKQTFAEECSGEFTTGVHADPARGHRSAGRRTSSRGQSGRPPGRAHLGGVGRFTRRSLERLDRYTLDVFNPDAPYRSRDDR